MHTPKEQQRNWFTITAYFHVSFDSISYHKIKAGWLLTHWNEIRTSGSILDSQWTLTWSSFSMFHFTSIKWGILIKEWKLRKEKNKQQAKTQQQSKKTPTSTGAWLLSFHILALMLTEEKKFSKKQGSKIQVFLFHRLWQNQNKIKHIKDYCLRYNIIISLFFLVPELVDSENTLGHINR